MFVRHSSVCASLALIVLCLSGCAIQAPAYLIAPTDPSRSKPSDVRSVISDARDWPIVESGKWGDLNRQITPKGGGK